MENVLAAGALAAAAGISILAVIARYAFGTVLFWSEETIIYLVIFSTFVGAVITLRHDEHVRVDLIPLFLRERGQRAFALLGALLMAVYLAVIGGFGWLLLFQPAASNIVTPALKLPLWFVELALPIGFTLMFLRVLEVLYRLLRGQEPYPEAHQSVLEAEASGLGMHIDTVDGVVDDDDVHGDGKRR